MSRFVITGAVGGDTQGAAAPNRLEINDFVKVEDQFSLYIQALHVMSINPQDELISFFQIGGIHGLPYVSWDGAGDQPVSTDGWEGYCTHGSVLFPAWHRPYVMLYEQVLQKNAKAIADTYSVDKQRWQKAAADLRQPYWDWARNAVPPAEVISETKVTIIGPDGKKTAVDNPLYHYKFHPIDPSFPSPYDNWQTTLRHPTSSGPDAKDNVAQLKSVLQNAQRGITSKTYNLLTRVHTWPAFSNHTPGDGGSTSNSLEAIHDGIHVDVGSGGQMSDPAVAGFDPIFFLHHCQVDRMLSLWSALNHSVWVTAGPEGDGTWTIPPDTTVDENSALTPFWDAQTTYWASAGVEVTAKLGYTYPEFNNLDMGNPNAVRAAIAKIVNELYGGPIFGTFSSSLAQVPGQTADKPGSQAPAAAPVVSLAAVPPAPAAPAPGGDHHAQAALSASGIPAHGLTDKIWEWTARIHVKKYELGGSFSVLLFLGAVPDNAAEWHTSANFVGAHSAFVNSAAGHCANCRNQSDVVIEGFVHLNDGIAKHSRLGSFEPNVVEPYLKRDLHWRVQKADGEVVDVAKLSSLEITVIATPLSLPPGEVFPVPGEAHHHHGITHSRQGGSRHA